MALSDRGYMKARSTWSRMSALIPLMARFMWIALGILLAFLFMIWQPEMSASVLHNPFDLASPITAFVSRRDVT
jgi:hypothetical protein